MDLFLNLIHLKLTWYLESELTNLTKCWLGKWYILSHRQNNIWWQENNPWAIYKTVIAMLFYHESNYKGIKTYETKRCSGLRLQTSWKRYNTIYRFLCFPQMKEQLISNQNVTCKNNWANRLLRMLPVGVTFTSCWTLWLWHIWPLGRNGRGRGRPTFFVNFSCLFSLYK